MEPCQGLMGMAKPNGVAAVPVLDSSYLSSRPAPLAPLKAMPGTAAKGGWLWPARGERCTLEAWSQCTHLNIGNLDLIHKTLILEMSLGV